MVHPMRRMAFCSAAAAKRGPNFSLMFMDRWTTSETSAMLEGRASPTNRLLLGVDALVDFG